MAAGPSSCYERKVANLIMRREWDEVLVLYDRMRCPDAKMNCKGDTVLHLAISDRLLDILDKLLDKLQRDSSMLERVLIAKNENGDTPLHIAAVSSHAAYCFSIINSFGRTGKPVQQLVEARNKDGETPLFVAIDHGHENVFDYLSYYVGSEEEGESRYKWWMKNDATTILHVAILGEHFELAHSIIRKYKELCYARNEKGDTPLHVLATMPQAFRTGSPPLPLLEQIIYESKWVSTSEHDYSDAPPKMNYPPIYKTCVDLLKLPRQAILAIGNAKRRSTGMEARQEEAIGSIRRTDGTPILAGRSRFEVPKQKFQRKCQKMIKRFTEFLFTRLVVNELLALSLHMLLTSPYQIGKLIISHFKDARNKAKKHYWAKKVMQQLVQLDDHYYNQWSDTTRRDPYSRISAMVENSGKKETKQSTMVENESESTIIEIEREDTMVEIEREVDISRMETPILIAARTGITEMVTEILKWFPNAIFDLRQHDQKNLVLIAVQNRRIHLWDYLKDKYQEEKYSNWRTLINMFDKDGNNALHIAAMHSDERPWLMPGEIMKMHWDARWFEYIAGDVPGSFSRKLNKDGKTPKQVFDEEHKEQNMPSEWLNTTASSCSVVASLITTVAYASAATVPGGNNDKSGEPHFIGKRRFHIFLITTFTALCFSVSSLICFLALLVSRQRPSDYSMRLPRSLLWGVSTLSISIAAMLASFCAGQFLYLRGHMLTVLLPIYDVFFALVIIGSIAQFPFFISLLLTVYLNKPQPCYRDEMVR